MPFDGTEQNPIVQAIDQIEAFFDGGRSWCQGHFTDAFGRRCLIGAILEVVPNIRVRQQLQRCLNLAVPERFMGNIVAFNDHHKTTFMDIQLVLAKAREIASKMPRKPPSPCAEIIDNAEAFFGGGKNWIQGQSMNESGGRCLGQALHEQVMRRAQESSSPTWFSLTGYIERAIHDISGDRGSIVGFNDRATTTYADIEKVLHRAHELATGE